MTTVDIIMMVMFIVGFFMFVIGWAQGSCVIYLHEQRDWYALAGVGLFVMVIGVVYLLDKVGWITFP